jgi:hypothetical protein
MKQLDFGRHEIWRALVISTFALFIAGFWTGWSYFDATTPQAQYYMRGRLAYMTTMYDLAVEYFDRSYDDYLEREAGGKDILTAPGSLEIAELSQQHKAMALLKHRSDSTDALAAKTFVQALTLTTEEALSRRPDLSQQNVRKIGEDRKTTQIDFEILLHQKPHLAKKLGKGSGDSEEEQKLFDDPAGKDLNVTDRERL